MLGVGGCTDPIKHLCREIGSNTAGPREAACKSSKLVCLSPSSPPSLHPALENLQLTSGGGGRKACGKARGSPRATTPIPPPPQVFLFFLFLATLQACGILVPRPGTEPVIPAVEARSLNHWTAREVRVLFLPAVCWAEDPGALNHLVT